MPVHYCAEHFSNDAYLPNLILKALKRVMAGEYSRELSDKVFAGLTRVAKQGFRPGGQPGYGFRRVLLSSEGVPKGELIVGERKSITNERVVLVLGPGIEVSCVREIYRMFISQGLSMQSIADELNRQAVPFQGAREWKAHSVRRILTNSASVQGEGRYSDVKTQRIALKASKSQHRNCATHTLGKVESAKTPGFRLCRGRLDVSRSAQGSAI